MKKIVIIGGGTGTYTLLSGLRQFPSENAVIVSTADDGGSSGRLRRDYGVVPPGDLRQCLMGLSYTDEAWKDIFSYRFPSGELKGHTVGNILLAAAELQTKSATKAIDVFTRLLNVRGEIIPVTEKPTLLSATLDNGKVLKGEHVIDEPKPSKPYWIKKLSLSPKVKVNPAALEAIKTADAIVFGPGDLYTSILPNVLVPGVTEAIQKSTAHKILVVNLMTKFGQSHGFSASDFLWVAEDYVGKGVFTHVVVNTKRPDAKELAFYKKSKAEFVEPDIQEMKDLGVEVASASLLAKERHTKAAGDTLTRSVLRHDPNKLAKLIWELL